MPAPEQAVCLAGTRARRRRTRLRPTAGAGRCRPALPRAEHAGIVPDDCAARGPRTTGRRCWSARAVRTSWTTAASGNAARSSGRQCGSSATTRLGVAESCARARRRGRRPWRGRRGPAPAPRSTLAARRRRRPHPRPRRARSAACIVASESCMAGDDDQCGGTADADADAGRGRAVRAPPRREMMRAPRWRRRRSAARHGPAGEDLGRHVLIERAGHLAAPGSRCRPSRRAAASLRRRSVRMARSTTVRWNDHGTASSRPVASVTGQANVHSLGQYEPCTAASWIVGRQKRRRRSRVAPSAGRACRGSRVRSDPARP